MIKKIDYKYMPREDFSLDNIDNKYGKYEHKHNLKWD